mgnify:FL=1
MKKIIQWTHSFENGKENYLFFDKETNMDWWIFRHIGDRSLPMYDTWFAQVGDWNRQGRPYFVLNCKMGSREGILYRVPSSGQPDQLRKAVEKLIAQGKDVVYRK